MVAFAIVCGLFLLLAAGVPVGFAMGVAGAAGLWWVGDWHVMTAVLATSPLTTVNSYELITIPMFLLMAEVVLASGITDDLFRSVAAWVGHIRGGLGMATALTGAAFGAMCGTSTASAAALAATSLPAMIKHGYEPRMAAGVVAISGTLAMLIPPAVALVIFGLLADVNVAKLLVAGVIPAMVVTLTIMGTVYLLARWNPAAAPTSPVVPFRRRVSLLRLVWPMLVLMAVVTGTIYTGIATPTEASALGAAGACAILAWKGRFSTASVGTAAVRAARSTCMIATILVGAQLFGYSFALTHVTQDLITWVATLDTSRWVILCSILSGYIVLGAFMDQIAILVLTVPIVVPVIKSLGFDPIWFGVIKIVTAEVGMITPPVGLNCFVVAKYSNRSVSEVFRGTAPHFVAHLVAIAILLLFPGLVLWLPSKMR
jgi:tripartite ATP-independent transporter DctM subunit